MPEKTQWLNYCQSLFLMKSCGGEWSRLAGEHFCTWLFEDLNSFCVVTGPLQCCPCLYSPEVTVRMCSGPQKVVRGWRSILRCLKAEIQRHCSHFCLCLLAPVLITWPHLAARKAQKLLVERKTRMDLRNTYQSQAAKYQSVIISTIKFLTCVIIFNP